MATVVSSTLPGRRRLIRDVLPSLLVANPLKDYVAVGLTFSIDAVRGLYELLKDEKYNFGAEGTGASGYELYLNRPHASEAIKVIEASELVGRFKIEFYRRLRDIDSGTRYDRLIDHYEGGRPGSSVVLRGPQGTTGHTRMALR